MKEVELYAKIAMANIDCAAMVAENQVRRNRGESVAYNDECFQHVKNILIEALAEFKMVIQSKEMPITTLNLSVRTKNALWFSGRSDSEYRSHEKTLETIADLCSTTANELLGLRNFGQ
ncbi:hypothetical protein KAR91_07670, partial [Candidatus Pacearchaeota archaeon]|nr:hypothetical protein [Candidatus Pacearchaeota archaeon]